MDTGGRAKQEARAEAVSARQKQAKKRSLRAVNEHFEPVFNAAMATQVVFQQPVRGLEKQKPIIGWAFA
nr:hypothetical protein [uncultured Pseudomonas sp.]